jgi:electron transfer flavoprotein alpha subunit
MNSIPRRDPRRPYVLTAAGIRRILTGQEDGAMIAAAGVLVAAGLPLRTTQTPVHHLLVIVRSLRGALDEPARRCIAAAALIASADSAVVVGVLGGTVEDLAACGADQVVTLEQNTDAYAPEQELAQVCALVERFRPLHLLLPEGSTGDLGRRLAVRQCAGIATGVVELDASHAARWQPAANGERRLAVCRPLPSIVLLEAAAAETRLPFVGHGERLDWQPPAQATPVVRDLGITRLNATEVPLEEATVIAAAGNGVRDVELFSRLAQALGAATGASRVVVDDGRLPRDRQIGATGRSVSADLYLAIGISGAVQHLQGIKDCRHVVAVNLDPGAPIIQRADLTVIDEAGSFMRALLAQLVDSA